MADIFGRNQRTGDVIISSDSVKAVLSAGEGTWAGLLIQSFQCSYSQQNSPLYELGSNTTYRLLGRPEGTLQIGKILGFNSDMPISQALFDVCNGGGAMTVFATNGGCDGQTGSFSLTFGGLRGSAYSMSADAGRLLVTENFNLTFNYMERNS